MEGKDFFYTNSLCQELSSGMRDVVYELSYGCSKLGKDAVDNGSVALIREAIEKLECMQDILGDIVFDVRNCMHNA